MDRSGFSGQILEVENLVKGDMIPVNIDGGYSNDLLVVDCVHIGQTETILDGFLIWAGRRWSACIPAFTQAEVWNT